MTNDTRPDPRQLQPTIHPTYARLLVAELRRRGHTHDAIYRDTGGLSDLVAADNRLMSLRHFRQLATRGIELTGEGWLGLDVGRSTQISSHGPIGYAMVGSPNVGELFEVAKRFSWLRLQIADFSIEERGDRVRLQVEEQTPWEGIREYICSNVAGAVVRVLEAVSPTGLPPGDLELPYPEPPWSHEYPSRLPGLTIKFGRQAMAFDFPASLGEIPCLTSDSASFQQALRLCEQALEAARASEGISTRVLAELLRVRGEFPAVAEVARALGTSARTLTRKLRAEGTSFQALLDGARQELATWYLRETAHSIEHIADILGYQDTSNFSRVCRRWTGRTPTQIRRDRTTS